MADAHIWLRGPSTGAGFTHYVAAVSNRRWPLASAKPQVAVCGFFRSQEEAAAYAAEHQRYKPGGAIPDGPIFLTLECGRLFPLALSPIRLFGKDSAASAKKRDAMLRNYYRKREVERNEVAARKAEEEKAAGRHEAGSATAPAPATASDDKIKVTDPRVLRTASRRARRHAWELLQRLRSQKDRLARAAAYIRAQEAASEGAALGGAASGSAAAATAELDDELADFLEGLTDAQRRALAAPAPSPEEAAEGQTAVEPVVPRTEINPAPKTKLGTIDAYIAWAERHFAKQGIVPASEEMMDREDRELEERAVASAKETGAGSGTGSGTAGEGSAQATAPPSAPASTAGASSSPSHRLPPPPENQQHCVGAIFFDDTGSRLNKDCPDAAGMEHVVTFFEPAGSAEAARTLVEKVYGANLREERIMFVRTGVWCCFDNVTDDDGLQIYREDMISEMFSGSAENHMLKFVEKALEQRPDMLPIPTTD
jgi:hypothetical protein